MRLKVDKCKKNVYLGHRLFLPIRHPLRKKGQHFKGEADHRKKPVHRIGDDIFFTVKDLKVIFGHALADNLFRMAIIDMHPCGIRSLYFGTYPTGKS